MSMSSGMNGWSSRSKAKKAYLRRHGVRSVTVDSPPSPPAQLSRQPQQEARLSFGGGLASISEQLFQRVTSYHAQIGSGVSATTLLTLESKLLDDAEATAAMGSWEEALNIFTHALAVSEKMCGTTDSATQASTQAAIVSHIGTCLHHLGELEAAKAYYEEAIASVRRLRTPTYERWFTNALGRVSGVAPPDVNHERVQFLKSRLHDIDLGRLPEREYHGECGPSRWTGIARRMTHAPQMGAHGDDDGGGDDDDVYAGAYADGYGEYDPRDEGLHANAPPPPPQYYYHGGHGGDGADGTTGAWAAQPSHGRVVVPPPASCRSAALRAATKAGNPEAAAVAAIGCEPGMSVAAEASHEADLLEREPPTLMAVDDAAGAADAAGVAPPLIDLER